jgi:methylenetetrahydrofolate dehydrogenase (NADP+)/methenyltetrahydrofolate cyclohydrolase
LRGDAVSSDVAGVDAMQDGARLIDGSAVAKKVRDQVAIDVAALCAQGVVPGLTVVLVGDDPASAVYVGGKEKASREAGMAGETIRLPSTTSQAELLALIDQLNHDETVHGILVQMPLPKQIDPETVIDRISPAKDVDGFHPVNVGKPMAALMMQSGPLADATVTVCHSRTRDLADQTRQADILIAAVGRAQLVTANMVKPGAVVIDVGMNRIPDASTKSGTRLVGDVDFADVRRVASLITPVPRGVGPMTIAMLLRNTVKAAQRSVRA